MPQGLYAASSNSVNTMTSPSGWAPLYAPAAPTPAAPPPTTTALGPIDPPEIWRSTLTTRAREYASTIEHGFPTLLRTHPMTARKLPPSETPPHDPDLAGEGGRTSDLHEIVSSIGPKLRELRVQRGMSLQQLAVQSDVSAAAIHKIERGGMVPNITTLLKIAAAFNRPVSYFVEEQLGENRPVAHIRRGDRNPIFTAHSGIDLAGISGPYGRFFLAGAIATVQPGANSGDKPMEHPREELIYVLQGTVERHHGLDEARERGLGDTGSDLPGPRARMEDARGDLRRDTQLGDPAGIDAERRAPQVEHRNTEPGAAARAHEVELPRGGRGVPHRAADEGCHRRRARGGRRTQPDQLQDRAVADVGGRHLRTERGVVERLADPGRGRHVPARRSCEADAELGPVARHRRDYRRVRHVRGPSGQRPSGGHGDGQEEEVVGGEELGQRNSSGVVEACEVWQQVTQQQVGARLYTDVDVVAHLQALAGDGHHVDRPVRPQGIVEQRAGDRGEEAQPLDGGGGLAAEPRGVARTLVHGGGGAGARGRGLDDPQRLRRPDSRHHRHARVVVVRRLERDPTIGQQAVGIGEIVGPALGDHRGPHRASQGVDGIGVVDARSAVKDRHALETRNDLGTGPDTYRLRCTAVEAPKDLGVGRVDHRAFGPVEPREGGDNLGVAPCGDPPIDVDHLEALAGHGVGKQRQPDVQHPWRLGQRGDTVAGPGHGAAPSTTRLAPATSACSARSMASRRTRAAPVSASASAATSASMARMGSGAAPPTATRVATMAAGSRASVSVAPSMPKALPSCSTAIWSSSVGVRSQALPPSPARRRTAEPTIWYAVR